MNHTGRLNTRVILLAGLLCLIMSACYPPSTPAPAPKAPDSGTIPFASLIQSETPGANQEKPVILFAGNAAEAEVLGNSLGDPSLAELIKGIDFDESVAVMVFRGQMASTGFGIAVESLTLTDRGVEIRATLSDPSPDQMTGAALTFPSELLTIKRSDITLEPGLTWSLIVDDQVLAEAQFPD